MEVRGVLPHRRAEVGVAVGVVLAVVVDEGDELALLRSLVLRALEETEVGELALPQRVAAQRHRVAEDVRKPRNQRVAVALLGLVPAVRAVEESEPSDLRVLLHRVPDEVRAVLASVDVHLFIPRAHACAGP